MTTNNYLDLDINKLFQEHTIKEIEEIQKKIQLECDRKKIELRTLVGYVAVASNVIASITNR